jgi:hypothetical protein
VSANAPGMRYSARRWFRTLAEEVLGSCKKPCAPCGERFHCLNKKSALRPTPALLWGCLAVATAVPLLLTLNPKTLARWYAGASAELMEREDVEECFGELMQRMQLQRPDRVDVMITDGVGPTCVGMDGPRGGVVLFPMELFALLNPATHVRFEGVFEGPVGELSEAQRQQLLDQGLLVPTREQLQFVFGHELAHLKHRHTLENSKVGFLVALLTHLTLKINNALAVRTRRFRFMEIRSTPVYSCAVLGCAAAAVLGLSWDQELQADATSARRLSVEGEAIRLKVDQLRQSQALRRMGLSEPLDLEHPPNVLQLYNLKRLKDSMKND